MLSNMDLVKREYDRFLSLTGEQLKEWRRELKLSMQALADICHVTRQTIFALENDHKDLPSIFHVCDSTKILVVMTLSKLENMPERKDVSDMWTVKKHIITSRKTKTAEDSRYFVVPPVTCKDGFTMSVQHSSIHYCDPREDFAERKGHEFVTYEVGYPSEAEDILMPFAENPNCPTETVYIRVPAQIVEQVAEMHGGIVRDITNC